MRLNWISTRILFLTPRYPGLSFSSKVKAISALGEKGLLHSFGVYTNLPIALPHRDVTVTKLCTNVCSYFQSAEFYHGCLGNVSLFPHRAEI